MQKNSPFFKYSKIIFNIGGAILIPAFIISSLSGFLNPTIFRGITFFAIGFPVLLVAAFVWCLLCVIIFYPGKWWCFLFLLLGTENLFKTYPFRAEKEFTISKDSNTLRVVSWNVNEFLYGQAGDNSWVVKQKSMLDFLKSMDADVLCFQDYIVSPGYAERDVTKFMKDSLGFTYYFFSMDDLDYGTIIFSKYPITDSARVKYKLSSHPESVAHADINVKGKSYRIFTTHFKSMFLHHNTLTPELLGDLKYVKEDTALLFHSNMAERLEYFDRIHSKQALLVSQELQKTKTPFIFCADLNSVPASYVYHSLRKNTKDAYLEAGSGLRGTYRSAKSLLRIDVILTSKNLRTKQFYSPSIELSDHYPLVADISLAN